MARKLKNLPLRKPQPTLIAEGATEYYYFAGIRKLCGLHFDIKPRLCKNCGSAVDYKKNVNDILNLNGSAIVVFDMDVATPRSYNYNKTQAEKYSEMIKDFSKNKNVIICDSKPSIEFWFLLHFNNTCRNFLIKGEITAELKNYLTDYEKNEKYFKTAKGIEILHNKLDTAIKNAKIIAGKPKEEQYAYSNIYKMFDYLEYKK